MDGGEFNPDATCFVNEEWIPCTGCQNLDTLEPIQIPADSSGPKLAPGLQSSPVGRHAGFNFPFITFVAGRYC